MLWDLSTFDFYLSCSLLPTQAVMLNWIYDNILFFLWEHGYLHENFCILFHQKTCNNSWVLGNFCIKVICCSFFITCWKLRAKFVPRLQICVSVSVNNNNWVSVYKSICSRAFFFFSFLAETFWFCYLVFFSTPQPYNFSAMWQCLRKRSREG